MTTTKAKKFTDDLDIAIGIRVRLSPEKKQEIKIAYDEKAEEERASVSPARGGISVISNTAPMTLIKAFGADRLTLSHILASNERHQVGMLRRWEKALDISIIDKKELEGAWKSYLAHLAE